MPATKPTAIQIATIDAILSIFETSTISGAYASLVYSPGDKGQLTYGKHQTTLASGNLAKLVERYVGAPGARHAEALASYVPDLQARDPKLNFDTYLKNLLRAAADEPVMRSVQDAFFIEVYRNPAFESAEAMGLSDALSWCIRYGGQVHGSWKKIADRTDDAAGEITDDNQRKWMSTYVALRRQFLADGSGDLPKTVYRMDVFRSLINAGAWDLGLPLVIRDLEVSQATLGAPPVGVYNGPAVGSRDISVTTPITKGADVRLVQLALSRPGTGFDITADGQFGNISATAVRRFQETRGLTPTGIVDAETIAALAP